MTAPAAISPDTRVGSSAATVTVRRALVATMPVYIASRLVVLFAAKATTWLFPQLTLTAGLSAWDGGWYLSIAEHGYPDRVAGMGNAGLRWAFLPGYPALVRGLSELSGLSLAISGVVLSLVTAGAAIVVIWMIVADVLGDEVATSTAAFVAFFPTSYVFSMVYTEGVFLLLAALCIRWVMQRRWLLAGLMAALACTVRVPGVALVLVMLAAAVVELRAHRLSLRMVCGVILSGSGVIAWMAYQGVRTGDSGASLEAQRLGWYNEFTWFRTPFRVAWGLVSDRANWSRGDQVLGGLSIVIVVAAAVLAVAFARRNRGVVPVEWWVFSIASIELAFSVLWPSSILRYCGMAFPLFAVALAQLPRRALVPVLCASAGLMAALCSVAIGGVVDWQHAPFAP